MSDDTPLVTLKNYKAFKKVFFKAAYAGQKTFTFEGKEVSVKYGQYIIGYFKRNKL